MSLNRSDKVTLHFFPGEDPTEPSKKEAEQKTEAPAVQKPGKKQWIPRSLTVIQSNLEKETESQLRL